MTMRDIETLEKIIWSDDFSVGHEKLDQQHFKIVSFINELIDRPEIKTQSEALDCIRQMLAYSVEHLEYEEKLLSENNYPDSVSHSVVHQFYVKKVENFLKMSFLNNNDFKFEVLDFLKEWWTYHILEEDMKYRPFLAEMKLG